MATIFSHLGIKDTDRSFTDTLGQKVVYDLIAEYLMSGNDMLEQAMSVFVEAVTQDHQERYRLTATGRLQRTRDGAKPAVSRTVGYWDVAYPLDNFADALTVTDIARAYMTAAEFQMYLDGTYQMGVNTRRYEILRRLFNNSAYTFEDEIKGALTIQPLANGDATKYPPTLANEETEETEDHYLVSGYAPAAISDANNPYVTLRKELVEHFGRNTGGPNVITFINDAQQTLTESLTDYVPVVDRFITPGNDTDVPTTAVPGPGELIGRTNGCHVKIWDSIPENYILSVHLDAPKPLKERVDPADTGLPRGLRMVAEQPDHPLQNWYWRDRFGYGTANRLNGALMFLDAGALYVVPSKYA